MDNNLPPNVDYILPNPTESASSMLKEVDALRMAFVRNNTTPSGNFKDDVDPKLGFKVIDDLSKSLARREKQEAESLAEMNMEQHRARALALADEVIKRQRTPGGPVERYDLNLPTLPNIADITNEEMATGIVKLDLNDYREWYERGVSPARISLLACSEAGY